MKPFKFFQKEEKGTLESPEMLNGETHSTASFNADTPESYMNRRMLYHTNQTEYDRLRGNNNNEMERYFYDREMRRDQPTGILHNDNHGNTDYVPFFIGKTRVTRVNPKWWMKIKMFCQKLFLYSDQIFPIIIFSTFITVIVSAVIAKILNIW